MQVDVPVAVPDVELDRQAEVGTAPDEEPVQHLVGEPGQPPLGLGAASLPGAAEPSGDGGDDLPVGWPPPVQLKPDPVRRDRLDAGHGGPGRGRGDPFAKRRAVGLGELGGAGPVSRQRFRDLLKADDLVSRRPGEARRLRGGCQAGGRVPGVHAQRVKPARAEEPPAAPRPRRARRAARRRTRRWRAQAGRAVAGTSAGMPARPGSRRGARRRWRRRRPR